MYEHTQGLNWFTYLASIVTRVADVSAQIIELQRKNKASLVLSYQYNSTSFVWNPTWNLPAWRG